MLHEGEPPELPAELEGGEDGVLAGEGDQRGRGQRAVRVDPRPRVPEAVLVPRDGALFTAASERDKEHEFGEKWVTRYNLTNLEPRHSE